MIPIRIHRGFSLIELLLAIFILGIGVISIATLFPAGIAQQQKTAHDVIGPIVARNAMTILRSRLEQEDFGGASQFDERWPFKRLSDPLVDSYSICDASRGEEVVNPWPTICGDWMWRRPAFVPLDYGDDEDPLSVAVRGAIDIFATTETEVIGGQGLPIVETWFPNQDPEDYANNFVPPGIPYNKDRYPDVDLIGGVGDGPDGIPESLYWPVVRVFASERQYPMWTGDPAERPEAEYYWDCMFRRYEGRVLVAIFVYRVVDPSQMGAFTIDTSAIPDTSTIPILDFPRHVDLTDPTQSSTGSWSAVLDSEALTDTVNDVPTALPNQWQFPGQWIIDQNGNVHYVQRGRRRPNDAEVRLASRPAEIPGFYSQETAEGFDHGVNVNWWEEREMAPQSTGYITEGVVTDIWFIPTNNPLLNPNTGLYMDRRIIPVYATVQEL